MRISLFKALHCLLLLLSGTCFSQQKFIEVTVGDTVALYPESFDCILMVGDSYKESEGVELVFNERAFLERMDQNRKKLEGKLKKHKYSYKPYNSHNKNYPPLSAVYNRGFSVHLKTAAQFHHLASILAEFDFVDASLENIIYKDLEVAEERLLHKIVIKANQKAAIIAAHSGLTAGNIMQLKEVVAPGETDLNVHDTYFIFDTPGGIEVNEADVNATMYKTYVVRFAAE